MKIFTRLTYNSNNWNFPSGQVINKKSKLYENIYGFGHEEWLFNPKFQFNEYQYGYIRGLTNDNSNFYEEVHLYTVKKEKNKNPLVFYVGYLNNVEGIINENDIQNNIVPQVFRSYLDGMLAEIETVNGDNSLLKKTGCFKASIRFKIMDMHLESEPIQLPNFDLGKYKRFMPYRLEKYPRFLKQIEEEKKVNIDFTPGKAKQTMQYSKTLSDQDTVVKKLHTDITNALEKYLKPNFTLSKRNLSIEKSRFDNCIADVVTLLPSKEIDIYEIKTTSNVRKNIREAIGQLLDYAVHSENKINELYIVSPVPLDNPSKKMLSMLNKVLKYRINYLYYDNVNVVGNS